MIAEPETAVRNALLAARASIDAALALMGRTSWTTLTAAAAAGAPTVPVPQATTLGATSTVKLPAPTCPHPQGARQSMQGMGATKVAKFYCRACESMVEE